VVKPVTTRLGVGPSLAVGFTGIPVALALTPLALVLPAVAVISVVFFVGVITDINQVTLRQSLTPAARVPEATVKASGAEATPNRRFGRRRNDVTLSEGLLERAKGGDRLAFEGLFTPYAADAFRLAVAMLQCREDAEDAVQNAMLKAWRRLATFR